MEMMIGSLKSLLSRREISCRELCEEVIHRNALWNGVGPGLNAVIEFDPDILSIAESVDREMAENGGPDPSRPLHGIPVLLKDSIDTGDRMMTAAGSLALAKTPALADAPIVSHLRRAGAIIMGKANMSEWANFRSTRSVSGWSSRGGQTRNPFDLHRSPCGSSSGSAAAVSAGIVPIAVGTETDGSIVCPAGMNSVVGIKPARGSINSRGIIPISSTQDTAGPFAACVSDATLLLQVLAGSSTSRIEALHLTMDTQEVRPLDGVRIGVSDGLCGFDDRVDRLFREALGELERLGATLVDAGYVAERSVYQEDELTLLLYEFHDGVDRYLAQRGCSVPVHSLRELIVYNQEHAESIMPFFGQELFQQAVEKGDLRTKEYLLARERLEHAVRDQGAGALFGKGTVDLLASPTNGPAWLIDPVLGDRYTGGDSSVAAVSGCPSLSVPMGSVCGLPIGLTLTGPIGSEESLLFTAAMFERSGAVGKVGGRIIPSDPKGN